MPGQAIKLRIRPEIPEGLFMASVERHKSANLQSPKSASPFARIEENIVKCIEIGCLIEAGTLQMWRVMLVQSDDPLRPECRLWREASYGLILVGILLHETGAITSCAVKGLQTT